MGTRAKIEQTIHVLYAEVFNNGRGNLLPGLLAGSCVRDSPLFTNGPEPLMAYLRVAGSIPCEVRRVSINGDCAVVDVRYPQWAGKERAAVDIFRFDEDGKMLEHRDALQPAAETAAGAAALP